MPKTYADLLRCVQQTMIVGQRETDEAWVRTFHETGRLIVSHIVLDQRAGYCAQVNCGVARDTGFYERKLYHCAQFYRAFPILQTSAKLGWTRCQLLCQIDSEPPQNALADETMKHDWPSRELQRRVRAFGELIVERLLSVVHSPDKPQAPCAHAQGYYFLVAGSALARAFRATTQRQRAGGLRWG